MTGGGPADGQPANRADAAAFGRAKAAFLDGLRCFEAGRFAEAEQHFVDSLARLPGRVSTLVNLAATRLRLGKPAEALADADAVLAAEPLNFDAAFHRANALLQLGRIDDARLAFEHALAQDDRFAEPWLRHGEALERSGRPDAALASYDRALAIEPSLADAWTRRGAILREAGRLQPAAEAFRQAVAHGADPALHGYYLAAVGAAPLPGSAPAHYVEALFDDYAADFDQHLRQALRYRAPEVLAENLARLAPGRRFRHALDLGCGTGMCGQWLRALADRLTGVDLSAGMLERACALGVYDRLEHADIVDFLGARRDDDDCHGFDLVVAADVFIYVGELAPVFGALQRRMPAGALLCLSAEEPVGGGATGDDGLRLQTSLRYAHSEAYLREQAARHGFDVVDVQRQPIREDQRRPIDGLFMVLARR